MEVAIMCPIALREPSLMSPYGQFILQLSTMAQYVYESCLIDGFGNLGFGRVCISQLLMNVNEP
jgi:hypothetical protein